MAKDIIWNKRIFDIVCEECMLTDFERECLLTHIKSDSATQAALKCNMSVDNWSKMIAYLKAKYDSAQAYCTELPERASKIRARNREKQ